MSVRLPSARTDRGATPGAPSAPKPPPPPPPRDLLGVGAQRGEARARRGRRRGVARPAVLRAVVVGVHDAAVLHHDLVRVGAGVGVRVGVGVGVRGSSVGDLGLGLGHVLELGCVAPQPLHEAVLLEVGIEGLALGAAELTPRDRVREVARLHVQQKQGKAEYAG
eukprot:scaffold59621_cov39-Phaeocystis_antarctica.AAC.1